MRLTRPEFSPNILVAIPLGKARALDVGETVFRRHPEEGREPRKIGNFRP